MKNNFYPIDNEILKYSLEGVESIDFKKYPDLLNILFSYWFSQKENYTRIKNQYSKGEFELSIREVQNTFGITKYRAEKLIKDFTKKELIKPIKKGSDKDNKSLYFNCIFSDSNSESYQTVKQTHKSSNTNTFSDLNQTLNQTDVQTLNLNYKKDNIKKNYKKDIYSASSEALWKLYPHKKGKTDAMKKIPKLIDKYGFEQMENCIKRYKKYVEYTRKTQYNLSYQTGSRFFNGTYADYLDENYEEQPIHVTEKPKEEFSAFGTDIRI